MCANESITVLRSTLDFMHFCQIWPKRDEELNASKWYYIKFVIVMLSTMVNLTGSVLHLCVVSIPNKSFYHVAEDLITVTAQVGVYYYFIVYVPVQKIAAGLFLKLSSFEAFGKPPDFDEHSIRLKYVALAYKMGLNVVVVAYFFEPMITKHMCERDNEARHFDDVCGLVTNSWMPFNIAKYPNKVFFYAWQTYSIYWTYEGSAAISFLIVGTMEHVLIRIWHLKSMIKDAIETRDLDSRRKKVSDCLEYHNHIFDLAGDVDTVYRGCLFVHVLFSGVLFGIMGFSILTVGMSIKTISLFVVWVCAALFSSLSAQRLYDGSLSIGEEVYNSEWYDTQPKFQKDLILIMKRAQQPITIHAGPFAELSNVFILTIFKTAYSYLTLLKASNQ